MQIGIGLHIRFSGKWQKEIGWTVAQTIAKETRRSNSHHGNRLCIKMEDAADYRRIRSILLLPQSIAHYRNRRSACSIVARGKHPSPVCWNAEHSEVIAGHELARI